jgi:hypothetical protein
MRSRPACTMFIAIALPLLIAPCLTAQERGSLVKGHRVRVVSRCEMARDSVAKCPASDIPWPYEWTYTGQLEALDGDTLHIRLRPSHHPPRGPTARSSAAAFRGSAFPSTGSSTSMREPSSAGGRAMPDPSSSTSGCCGIPRAHHSLSSWTFPASFAASGGAEAAQAGDQ